MLSTNKHRYKRHRKVTNTVISNQQLLQSKTILASCRWGEVPKDFRSRVSSRKMYTACIQQYGRHCPVCTVNVFVGPQRAGCYVYHHSTVDSLYVCTGRLNTLTVWQELSTSTIENLCLYVFLKYISHTSHIHSCTSQKKTQTTVIPYQWWDKRHIWYRPVHHLGLCALPMLRCSSFLAYTPNWPVMR